MGQAPVPAARCAVSDATSTNCGSLQLPQEQGYFAEEVKQQLLDDPKYNLGADKKTRENAVFGGGLKVYTTLDPQAQAVAEQAVKDIVPKNDKGVVGAVASVEPSSGAVRVMVGGPGFDQFKYNITTHQPGRQTGSSFKTFTLITAMEQGNVPSDSVGGSGIVLPDKPKPFAPQGPGGSLTSVTAASSNAAFVRLNMVVGPQNVVDTAKRLGVTSDMLPVPSLTLGTFLTTPLEMASAYSALPNNGVHEPYYLVDRIEDRNGKVIYEHTPSGTRAMSQQTACLTTQILNENTKSGTAVRARLNGRQEAAGKTGTTDKGADTWFVGSTPYLATAVWMGNPENETDNIEYIGGVENFGGVFPARIWHQLNQTYHENRDPLPLAKCANTRGGRTVKGEGENKYAFGGDTGQTTSNGRR
jgi:penicillin-binding protein 1A